MSASNENGLQQKLEKNVGAFLIVVAFVLTIGGIVEIVPLFYLNNVVESAEQFEEVGSVRPYTALELAGRDIYLREGCYNCHSQMIRPFRDEKERYGHFSLAVESKYDHPHQWGSKRTGPDLARVGGKYSNEWHIAHLMDPRSLVPESVMPRYPWLKDAKVDPAQVASGMSALKTIGVPYTDEQISGAAASVTGKTEMEALVAYLQVLGTMIEFKEGRDYRE